MLFLWYPNCSTCRKAKKWLDAHNVRYSERDIKEAPPSADELKEWRRLSALPLKNFFNTSGLAYKALRLKERFDSLTDDERYALLASDGMLVKRPLLIFGDRVLVGFREAEWERALEAAEQ